MFTVSALLAGLVFGWGLLLSGMANPAKVLAFLDLGGAWDPSLALVMAGAIAVGWVGFRGWRERRRSALGAPVQAPPPAPVDRRLVLGSVLFGVGWGLAGFCPGPALVALGMGSGKALIFTAAMVLGMAVFEGLERRRSAPSQTTGSAP